MFNFFKKRCPICKMEIKDEYVEGFGKKFCSEECREEYRKRLVKEQSKSAGHNCCH